MRSTISLASENTLLFCLGFEVYKFLMGSLCYKLGAWSLEDMGIYLVWSV